MKSRGDISLWSIYMIQTWPLLSVCQCYVEEVWRERSLGGCSGCLSRPWRRTKISRVCLLTEKKKLPQTLLLFNRFFHKQNFPERVPTNVLLPIVFFSAPLPPSLPFYLTLYSLATKPELKIIHFRHRQTKKAPPTKTGDMMWTTEWNNGVKAETRIWIDSNSSQWIFWRPSHK